MYAAWKCLEYSVKVDAVIVLNKTSFEEINSIRLQGINKHIKFTNIPIYRLYINR